MEPWLSLYYSWAQALHQQWKDRDPGPRVAVVYHPLTYAFDPFSQFLRRLGSHRRPVLFLGMNPGPWGMTQTGVPFGSVPLVRDWMGIEGTVGQPDKPHPARPVTGFGCQRTEVSGARFWGLMRRRFGTLDRFAQTNAVHSFCPLVFMDSEGRNVTPDHLPRPWRLELEASGADLLRSLTKLWGIEAVACLGHWAFAQAQKAGVSRPVLLPHPSPIHPGSRDWENQAEALLVRAGLWSERGEP